MDKRKRRQVQFSAIYVLIAVLGIWLFQTAIFRPWVIRWTEVSHSEFMEQPTEASNDLERATALARMIAEFGMAEAVAPVRYAADAGYGYLGVGRGIRRDIAPETAALIDKENRRLVDEAQGCAGELVRAKRAALDKIAETLQEHEVISGDEIARIAEKQLLEDGDASGS